MSFESKLSAYTALSARKSTSDQQLERIRSAFQKEPIFKERTLMVFCAGSIARKEVGVKSDLDLFVMSSTKKVQENLLYQYRLFGKMIEINKALGFEEFSNNGRFLKIYDASDIQEKTGTPEDDNENLFTARMLLLLESEYISNEKMYAAQVEEIVANYFRDSPRKHAFKPLFLLNDILRYWRTLCLNYEQRRKDPDQPWRKKNINLKFARMLTIYSTVLAIVTFPLEKEKEILKIVTMRPLDRLVYALDKLGDPNLLARFDEFLRCYETFLTWKEMDDVDTTLRNQRLKDTTRENAETFSTFLYDALMHKDIKTEYKKFLVI